MKKREAAIRLESRPPAMRFKKSERRESVPQRSLRRCLASRGLFQRDGLTRFGLPSCLKVLLVEDLLHQVGGGLGECELAEARIDGSEVGVDDLVESVVLHDVSFRSAWRRVSVFLSIPLAAAVSLCLLSIFFSSFFCCAFILRRASRQCHATIVTSFVKSSANLEEKVTFAENWRTHLIVHILCVSCWL